MVYTDDPALETHGVWKRVDAAKYARGVGHVMDAHEGAPNSLANNTACARSC